MGKKDPAYRCYSRAEVDQLIKEQGFATEPYRRALEQILGLPTHRNTCCATGRAKAIAKQALDG